MTSVRMAAALTAGVFLVAVSSCGKGDATASAPEHPVPVKFPPSVSAISMARMVSTAPELPRLADATSKSYVTLPWEPLRLISGGRGVIISTSYGACSHPTVVLLTRTSSSVILRVLARKPSSPPRFCSTQLYSTFYTVTLGDPLGNRQLLRGV